MAPLTRKRKKFDRDNNGAVDPIDIDSEEPGPTPSPARNCTGRKRQSKRPQKREDIPAAAKSGNVISPMGGNKKTRASTFEVKQSMKRTADDLKKYIKTEMSSKSQTEKSPLIELVASVEMSGDTVHLFPYLSSAYPGKAVGLADDVYKNAMDLVAEYRAVAREYSRLSEGSSTAKMPSWLRWEKDSADLDELNKRMLTQATMLVEQQVVPSSIGVEPYTGEDDVEQIAWELLEDAHPRKAKMGALKYVEELQKKKQSDLMSFLLRYRQLNVIHRAPRPSRLDKARRLGYKAKQGYVIYRVRVRRGGRKRPAPKGATYGKPTNQGINQLKYQRSLKATAEERVGRRCANLRVLNSYWINQDSTYKYYEVILVDPQHKAIRIDPRINWIVNPVHKHREARGLTATGKKSRGLNKGHRYNKTSAGRRKTWLRHNTTSLWRYR
ncbi:hypothetical protein EsHS_00005795 [Epichloe bromicola]